MSRQSPSDRLAGKSKRVRVHAVGRPPKDGDLADVRKDILFEPNEWAEIESALGDVGKRGVSPRLRELLLEWARGELVKPEVLEQSLRAGFDAKLVALGTDAFRAPILSDVPCGPWDKALEEAPSFAISRDTALELEARPGDVFVRARGESMTGAGIVDGQIALVRPLGGKPPRRHDIMIVQIARANGEIEGTLKRYDGPDAQGRERLLDGAGEPFALPNDVTSLSFIARVQGTLGLV